MICANPECGEPIIVARELKDETAAPPGIKFVKEETA